MDTKNSQRAKNVGKQLTSAGTPGVSRATAQAAKTMTSERPSSKGSRGMDARHIQPVGHLSTANWQDNAGINKIARFNSLTDFNITKLSTKNLIDVYHKVPCIY